MSGEIDTAPNIRAFNYQQVAGTPPFVPGPDKRAPLVQAFAARGVHGKVVTLDYWAGYLPNPEDAERLRLEAKKLTANSTLLKPVGSFRPDGTAEQEPIYDLGGNAAEWVLTRDGKGKIIGGSADCPADPPVPAV